MKGQHDQIEGTKQMFNILRRRKNESKREKKTRVSERVRKKEKKGPREEE